MSEQDWALPEDEGRGGLLRREIAALRAANERLQASSHWIVEYAETLEGAKECARRALEAK